MRDSTRPGLSLLGITTYEIYGYLEAKKLTSTQIYGTSDRIIGILGPAVFVDERTGELIRKEDDAMLWTLPTHGGRWTDQERKAFC